MDDKLEELAVARLGFPDADLMWGYLIVPKFDKGYKVTGYDIVQHSWSGGPAGINKPKVMVTCTTYGQALDLAIELVKADLATYNIK